LFSKIHRLTGLLLIAFGLGMVLDFIPIVLVLTPVFMPIIRAAGVDPVYFGVVFIMTVAIGMITPPVGLNLYVASGISRMGMTETTIACFPWLLTMLLFLMIITYWPPLSLWLPRTLGMM
ncbi:MAG TPA: TRAP transporter large permease subunit, partial [Chromatiaceae bacterium]|nr:TRAP transporter large permease subunit [Chromatiaceae bacterium]